MKLFLVNREQLQALGSALVSEFDSIVARVRGAWNQEHNDDDTHGNVHADTIATGRLTFSDIVDESTSLTQLDNYEPGGLQTAAFLRLTPSVDVTITGLKVPQDESGTVLDGRVLTIQNASTTANITLPSEHTASIPRNRFVIPYSPTTADTLVANFYLPPASITVLIYNAKMSRWLIASKTNEDISVYATFSGTQNDWAPTGYREAALIRFAASAASSTITGLSRTNVPVGARKKLVNNGLYLVTLQHMHTGSVANNRFVCSGGIRYMLHPRESVDVIALSEGGWRVADAGKADQWIDVTYSAGNFTTDTGTWTVASGDQAVYQYQIDGNKLTLNFRINSSSVATSPTQLRIAVPGGRTIARDAIVPLVAINAGVQITTGLIVAAAGNTFIQIFRDTASTAWGNATDTTAVWGQIAFMINDATGTMSESHSDVAHGDTAHSDADHSDVAHSDVAHGDSHGDAGHTDTPHSDVAHVDTTSHSDVSHSDSAHSDSAHADTPHSDTPHDDVANTHTDTPHSDHDDLGSAQQHDDVDHGDGGSYHSDVAHSDEAHVDSAHSDVAHSDVAHVDSSSHSDTAHSDVAHVDGGHSDSHSDTAPHSDVAHVDVAHGDTAHADAAHQDVGYHTDTAHTDI